MSCSYKNELQKIIQIARQVYLSVLSNSAFHYAQTTI